MCALSAAMNRFFLFSSLLAASACATQDSTPEVANTEQASSHTDCPAGVPAAIVPAADQDLAFTLAAEGVQKYTCNGTAWVFVAPVADLFRSSCGHHGEVVATHYAGPTWEYEDGSTVVGAKVAGATVDPTAIPWLLLTAVSHNDVDGRMSNITSIQRLDTHGGTAPATGCDAAHTGAGVDVPYTATYAFYRTRANGHHNARCGG